MSDIYATTMRITSDLWKRINREREPRENFSEALSRLLDERERLKTYAKGVIKDIA